MKYFMAISLLLLAGWQANTKPVVLDLHDGQFEHVTAADSPPKLKLAAREDKKGAK